MVSIYENPSKCVNQGDILILNENEIKENFFRPEKEGITLGLIVISNSCDIENKNIDYICLSPIVTLNYLMEELSEKVRKEGGNGGKIKKSKKKFIENLMKYNKKKYFYLPKNIKYKINESAVVAIEIVLNYPLNSVIDKIFEKRICTLKSPWKEKFGWSVGNLYNRVSLEDFHKNHINYTISNIS